MLRRFPVRALALVAAALPVDALAANCGGLVPCACGDTVIDDVVLTADLVCNTVPTVGLTVGADGVTIDGAGFAVVMRRASARGVLIDGFEDVVVQNLEVRKFNATFTTIKGIEFRDADGIVLQNNVLADLRTGIESTGSASAGTESTGVTIVGNDVSGSSNEGMILRGIAGTFTFTGNDLSSSKRALTLTSLVGPWALDPSNLFTGSGTTATDWVVKLETVVDVTLDGLDLSSSSRNAAAVQVAGSDGLTITNCDLSGREHGVLTAAFGTTNNTNGTITGNDVSNADVWGMLLEDWDHTLTLSDNVFDGADNGLRLADINPGASQTLTVDLATSSFEGVGDTTQQTAVKIVRSHDVLLTGLATTMVGRGTGVKVEDSYEVDVDEVLVCGPTRVGIDLGINPLDPTSVDGADDVIVGSPGNVYVEDADLAGVRVSVESENVTLDGVVAHGAGDGLVDNGPSTSGTVSRVGVPGWAFADADGDTCNDLCSDGADADGDSFCDAGDFLLGTTLLDAGDVPWVTEGVGSPSVVWDAIAGHFVMVYETQTGAADGTCLNGYWSLGLATSPDGITWTDAGGPLLSPSTGTYYACVAAHPSIVQNGGTTVVFFKAEKEQIDNVARYTGVGRMLLSWNGTSYDVTGPDTTVVLTQKKAFGYVRALYDSTAGAYRVALSKFPQMMVTAGPAAGPFAPLTSAVAQGDVGWGPDEVFNPAVACSPEDSGFSLFLGGRTLSGTTTAPVVDDQGLGRMTSANFASWQTGSAGATVATASGDPELRHWDVLPLGDADYAMFFDDKGGPGGTNRIRVATTSGAAWTSTLAATMGDKVCAP